MSKAKKRMLITIPIVLAALASVFSLWYFVLRDPGDGEAASVEKVSVITGMGGGISSRFAGVIEPQDTIEYSLESSRTLEKTYVEVGQEIAAGEPLFAYSTDDIDLRLEQMRLDIERVEDTIEFTNEQITILDKQREKAKDELLLELTTQIKSYEAQVKQEEYNLKSKRLEVEQLKDQVDNSVIYADIDGVIQSISQGANEYDYGGYGSSAYIVLVAQGDYRVRGQINEQNVSELGIGSDVLVRSRTHEEITWTGVIDYVDYDSYETGSNDYYGYMDSSDNLYSSTKFPFYVSLDSSENLLLGQHVIIEPYTEGLNDKKIWLLEYYILFEENGSYVWAVNQDKDKLEKRRITTGEYDEARMCYEITGGLDFDDEIAWPTDDLRAGMSVLRGSFAPPDVGLPVIPDPQPDTDAETHGEEDDPGTWDWDYDPEATDDTQPPQVSSDIDNATYTDLPPGDFEYPASDTNMEYIDIDD